MGISRFTEPLRAFAEIEQRPPVYKKQVGECMASVWEERVNGKYNLTVRFQRIWEDSRGKKRFADSFYPEHLNDLRKLMSDVQSDIDAAIEEEKQAGRM